MSQIFRSAKNLLKKSKTKPEMTTEPQKADMEIAKAIETQIEIAIEDQAKETIEENPKSLEESLKEWIEPKIQEKEQETESEVKTFGNQDLFVTLNSSKYSAMGYHKSNEAMEITGVGCVIKSTIFAHGHLSEALTFVPGVKIWETKNEEGEVTERKLVSL